MVKWRLLFSVLYLLETVTSEYNSVDGRHGCSIRSPHTFFYGDRQSIHDSSRDNRLLPKDYKVNERFFTDHLEDERLFRSSCNRLTDGEQRSRLQIDRRDLRIVDSRRENNVNSNLRQSAYNDEMNRIYTGRNIYQSRIFIPEQREQRDTARRIQIRNNREGSLRNRRSRLSRDTEDYRERYTVEIRRNRSITSSSTEQAISYDDHENSNSRVFKERFNYPTESKRTQRHSTMSNMERVKKNVQINRSRSTLNEDQKNRINDRNNQDIMKGNIISIELLQTRNNRIKNEVVKDQVDKEPDYVRLVRTPSEERIKYRKQIKRDLRESRAGRIRENKDGNLSRNYRFATRSENKQVKNYNAVRYTRNDIISKSLSLIENFARESRTVRDNLVSNIRREIKDVSSNTRDIRVTHFDRSRRSSQARQTFENLDMSHARSESNHATRRSNNVNNFADDKSNNYNRENLKRTQRVNLNNREDLSRRMYIGIKFNRNRIYVRDNRLISKKRDVDESIYINQPNYVQPIVTRHAIEQETNRRNTRQNQHKRSVDLTFSRDLRIHTIRHYSENNFRQISEETDRSQFRRMNDEYYYKQRNDGNIQPAITRNASSKEEMTAIRIQSSRDRRTNDQSLVQIESFRTNERKTKIIRKNRDLTKILTIRELINKKTQNGETARKGNTRSDVRASENIKNTRNIAIERNFENKMKERSERIVSRDSVTGSRIPLIRNTRAAELNDKHTVRISKARDRTEAETYRITRYIPLISKNQYDTNFIEMKWQHLFYLVQAIYLCSLLIKAPKESNASSKKYRITDWFTPVNFLKID